MGSDTLNRGFQYYLDHQDELVEKYNGKVLAIRGEEIVEVFDCDRFDAVIKLDEMGYEPGTICVRKVSPGPEGHTATVLNPGVYFPD